MKKGINYIRANVSLDQGTIDMLHKLAEGDFRYSNASAVVRQAIKEFYAKHAGETLIKQDASNNASHGGNA